MRHSERDEMGDDDGRRRYGPWIWSAYRAYNELLREKLRKRFDSREGPWLDKVADVLVQIVDARWEGGRKKEKELEDLYAKLAALLEE